MLNLERLCARTYSSHIPIIPHLLTYLYHSLSPLLSPESDKAVLLSIPTTHHGWIIPLAPRPTHLPEQWQRYLLQIAMDDPAAFLWELTSVLTLEARPQKEATASLCHKSRHHGAQRLKENVSSASMHSAACACHPCMTMDPGHMRAMCGVRVFNTRSVVSSVGAV